MFVCSAMLGGCTHMWCGGWEVTPVGEAMGCVVSHTPESFSLLHPTSYPLPGVWEVNALTLVEKVRRQETADDKVPP